MKRKLSGSVDYGGLGYYSGKKVPGVIGFRGLKPKLTIAEAKAMCAAIGTLGSSGMFVQNSKEKVETIEFSEKEYDETISELSQTEHGDAVVFGCPQMTIEELRDLGKSLGGKRFKNRCIVVCSSSVYEVAREKGFVKQIESAGATILRDACADFTPLISTLNVDSVETDSCKGAHYMRKVHGVKIALRDTKSILEDNVS